MKRIGYWINRILRGMLEAVSRFPLTTLCLVFTAGILSYMVWISSEPPMILVKLLLTLLVGAVLFAAAQAIHERIAQRGKRFVVYGAAFLLFAAYFLLLPPAATIETRNVVRTIAVSFAAYSIFLWFSSGHGRADFNGLAMTHFKAVFTSILYAGVLFLGLAAILGSVDVLLFSIDNRAYINTAIIVWVLFAPIYYLSLLPRFHLDSEEEREKAEHAARCPRFLEILLSYIAIPLLAAFTAVLAAYFIKILVTLKWPAGQLGPMVLGYSAAGLILYVLAGNLENRTAALYRAIFPKVLVPVVILQIVSIVIRLNAYGVTEPRYYVALFAVFSLICAALFSFLNKSRNQIIAPLAAVFALISALPPVDAFTISRMSQVGRLETILSQQGMLQNGKLTPKTDLSNEVKQKVGNILSYLNSAGHLSYVAWLPKGFVLYEDMEKTFGFGFDTGNASSYSDVHLDTTKAIDTSGFNVMLDVSSYRYENMQSTVPLVINGVDYQLQTKRLSDYDLQISLLNSSGKQLVSTQLYSFAKTVLVNAQSLALPPETLTLEAKAGGYKLRVVFTGIYQEAGSGADYQYYVLVGAPG